MSWHASTRTVTVTALNGIKYAYRRQGTPPARPLLLFPHFRGNLDDWDLGLIDALASSAHGFLFQHQREFARDVSAFLDESLSKETRA